MNKAFYRLFPPFELPSSIVYFHDWRYVQHGAHVWRGADGRTPPLFTLEDTSGLRYEPTDLPHGIELVAKPAQKSETVFDGPEHTFLLGGGCLVHEQGVYRLWYECAAAEHIGDGIGHRNLIYYAESDDSVTWRHPKLNLIEHRGTKQNAVVLNEAVTGPKGVHGASVFRDLSAPEPERYKAVFLGKVSAEAFERARKQRPQEIDPLIREPGQLVLCGAVSPDGLRWRAIDEPLCMKFSDTHNVCEYDAALKQYVWYARTWLFGKRTIGRAASADFRQFPLPADVLWPGPAELPTDVWYSNAKTTMPGAPDYHVMFPQRWSLADDRFEFHLATSPDNVTWNLVPGGPLCGPGPVGAFDAGAIGPGVGLVDLPGDRIGILYAGFPVPHKHPRRPPLARLALATWRKGRLVALRARERGTFSLQPLKVRATRVRLNYCTAPGGWIRVEIADAAGKAFADCDPITGDSLDQLVTWRGGVEATHPIQLDYRAVHAPSGRTFQRSLRLRLNMWQSPGFELTPPSGDVSLT